MPEYVATHGGYAITAAINQHIFVAINRKFDEGFTLRYSEIEHAQKIDDIRHPIIREALRLYEIPPGVEIVSTADIPAGTGLGSSGAFAVGLCHALSAFTSATTTREELAQQAARIELDILKRPGGRQDHWATALGGTRELTFQADGQVGNDLISIPATIESSLCLFFTGYSRNADTILSSQTMDGLDEIKFSAYAARNVLMNGDTDNFGHMLNLHWELKKLRSTDMSNAHIDSCYTDALKSGAIGGKLVGAGGNGFLLFTTNSHHRLRAAMAERGLQEVPFKFDHDGTSILVNDR